MFQYDGSEYIQLNPNTSNSSYNSNQLGGIESSQYAIKEYVNANLPFYLKYIDNFTSVNKLSQESTYQDILKAKGLIVEYKMNLITDSSSRYSWGVYLNIGPSLTLSNSFATVLNGYKNASESKAIERSMFLPKTRLFYGYESTTQNYIYAQYVDYTKYGMSEIPVLTADSSNTYLYNKFFLTTTNVSSITIDYCKLWWLV